MTTGSFGIDISSTKWFQKPSVARRGHTDSNRHIGDELCDQEELRGFTKRQVYDKRSTLSKAGRVKL